MTAPVRGFPQTVSRPSIFICGGDPVKGVIRKIGSRSPILTYPLAIDVQLEIFGFVTENGDSYAIVRSNGQMRKLLVRFNGNDEPYVSTSARGIRTRVYLSDCRRVMQ